MYQSSYRSQTSTSYSDSSKMALPKASVGYGVIAEYDGKYATSKLSYDIINNLIPLNSVWFLVGSDTTVVVEPSGRAHIYRFYIDYRVQNNLNIINKITIQTQINKIDNKHHYHPEGSPCWLCKHKINPKYAEEHSLRCMELCDECNCVSVAKFGEAPHICNKSYNYITVYNNMNETSPCLFSPVDEKLANSCISERCEYPGYCTNCNSIKNNMIKVKGCICKNPYVCYICFLVGFRKIVMDGNFDENSIKCITCKRKIQTLPNNDNNKIK